MIEEHNGTDRFLENIAKHVRNDLSNQLSKESIEEIVRSVWRHLADPDPQSELGLITDPESPNHKELANYILKRLKEQNIDASEEIIDKILAIHVEYFALVGLTEPI